MEPVSESPPDDPGAVDPPGKVRLRRARTGCLKCRVRRRKCDEGKPRCQRCVDGNFDCRYPTGVTFLDKNTITIVPSQETKESQSGSKYSRLQFLEPGSSSSRKKKKLTNSHHDHHPPRHDGMRTEDFAQPEGWPASPADHQHEFQQPQLHRRDSHVEVASMTTDSTPSMPPWTPSVPSVDMSPGITLPERNSAAASFLGTRTTSSDGYETALQVLLSLGADGGAGTSPSATILTDPGAGFASASLRSTLRDNMTQTSDTLSWAGSVAEKLSGQHIINLLRHYRYDVAPWLDICDTTQAFGLGILQHAIASDEVLEELLALSAVSLQGKSRSQKAAGVGDISAVSPSWSTSATRPNTTTLVAATLRQVQVFINTPPDSWTGPFSKLDTAILNNWELRSALNQRLSCLLLRLEISAALVVGTSPELQGLPVFEPQPQWELSATAEGIFQYASRPLVLCARVLRFCCGDPVPQSPGIALPVIAPAVNWRELAEELNVWYSNRPEEFQPMVELEADGFDDDGVSSAGGHGQQQPQHLFPTILFTNGAASFANQLYHTAMLLLLQNKPRTLALEHRRSAAMSPLWHAQRICGMALNNDRRECWDPSLVASLYVAAKGMTYEPQQREILRALDRVTTTTGWDIGRFKTMLEREWNIGQDG